MRRVDTSCEDCVFASYEDDVQVGCALGRIEALEANGAGLIPETKDGTTCFRIVGRYCNAIRGEEWAEAQDDRSDGGLVDAVYKEVRIRPLAVVHADPSATDEQIEASLASLSAQDLPPGELTLCFVDEMGRATRWCDRLNEAWTTCPWNVVVGSPPTEQHQAQYPEDDFFRMTDEAVRSTKRSHYTAARAGFEWPSSYFRAFDDAVNVRMEVVVALLPAPNTDGDGYLASKFMHDWMYENRSMSLCDKLIGHAKLVAEDAAAKADPDAEVEPQARKYPIVEWADLGLVRDA